MCCLILIIICRKTLIYFRHTGIVENLIIFSINGHQKVSTKCIRNYIVGDQNEFLKLFAKISMENCHHCF